MPYCSGHGKTPDESHDARGSSDLRPRGGQEAQGEALSRGAEGDRQPGRQSTMGEGERGIAPSDTLGLLGRRNPVPLSRGGLSQGARAARPPRLRAASGKRRLDRGRARGARVAAPRLPAPGWRGYGRAAGCLRPPMLVSRPVRAVWRFMAAHGCGSLAPACAQRTHQLARRASLSETRVPPSPRSEKMRTWREIRDLRGSARKC